MVGFNGSVQFGNGDPLEILQSTLFAAGTFNGTTGATNLTDTTKSWTTNQWAGYSVTNLKQNFACQITSNTATTLTCTYSQYGGTWTSGDNYAITKATQCLDQPGVRGNNFGTATYAAPLPAAQTIDPSYEWDEGTTTPTSSGRATIITQSSLIPYYSQLAYNQTAQTSSSSPFNGTAGTGWGTKANMPSTCSPGVGYWATNEGTWNTSTQSYLGGFRQGNLYICNSSGAWPSSPSYTPYTYPHPLVASVAAAAVTLTPSSYDFGNQMVGVQSAGYAISLQNTGSAVLSLSSMVASGDFGFSSDCPLSPSTLGVGDSCTITATFTPTQTGARAGTISIVDDAAGSPQAISLSGTGSSMPTGSLGMGISAGYVIIR